MSPKKPSPAPDVGSVLLTDRARAHYEGYFLPRYRQFLAAIDQTEMTVLIWGPGSNGGNLYQKRLQIRDELRAQGITALFSEEISAVVSEDEHSLSAQELAQAKASDLIITIQCSFGSTAEVHDMGRLVNTIASKLLVFIDQDAVSGYSYQGLLKPMQERFKNVIAYKYPEDITDCHLTGQVLKLVRVVREAKWFKSHE